MLAGEKNRQDPHSLGNRRLVDLLKIDVEGHEMAVLEGAREVIARSPRLRVVLEWSVDQLAAAGTSADEMIDLFDSLGLVPRGIPASGLIDEAPVTDAGALRAMRYTNIILSRPG